MMDGKTKNSIVETLESFIWFNLCNIIVGTIAMAVFLVLNDDNLSNELLFVLIVQFIVLLISSVGTVSAIVYDLKRSDVDGNEEYKEDSK